MRADHDWIINPTPKAMPGKAHTPTGRGRPRRADSKAPSEQLAITGGIPVPPLPLGQRVVPPIMAPPPGPPPQQSFYVDRGPAPLPEFRGLMPARLGRPGPVLVPPGEPIPDDDGAAERSAADARSMAPPPAAALPRPR